MTSEQRGARRYLRVDRSSTEFSATRAYTFPGVVSASARREPKCITAERHGLREFEFITRQELRQALSQGFRATGAGPLARTMSRQRRRSLTQLLTRTKVAGYSNPGFPASCVVGLRRPDRRP